jgi:hypothetical protein
MSKKYHYILQFYTTLVLTGHKIKLSDHIFAFCTEGATIVKGGEGATIVNYLYKGGFLRE